MTSSILIVDDETDACHNLADILSDMGYQVEIAHNGQTAMTKVRGRPFDVALLDLMMPDMDGAALYQEMKRRRPEIVAVLTTAYPAHPRAEIGVKSGIWRVIPKPVDLERLLGTVAEAMHQPILLIVDDDRDLCANIWDLFRERGYRVGIADGVQSAAEMLRESAVKVVLIDMQLSDGDGAQVVQAIREKESQPRTVIITGNRGKYAPVIDQLQQSDVDAVCYKPFDMRELLTIVDRLSRT